MKRIAERAITAGRSFRTLLKNPDSQTYYPEQPRKGRFGIFRDNLLWLLKHGEINHYYYLYGLDRKGQIPRNAYIPKRRLFTLQATANGPVRVGNKKLFYGCLLQDKFIFAQYLASLGLPTPRVLGFGTGESIYWIDERATLPLEMLAGKLDSEVFIKPVLGDSGKGILLAEPKEGRLCINGRIVDTHELKHHMAERYIIQEPILQADALNQLCTRTVASMRIITAMKDRHPVYITSLLTLSTSDNRMSNWFAGGVTVGIDPQTGQLKKYAFNKPGFGTRITRHPATGIAFEGFTLPYYKEAVELALKAHRYFYGTHSIGWDMAITNTGPVFIEGNNLWGMGSLQANNPGFVENYLASLPGHKKNHSGHNHAGRS